MDLNYTKTADAGAQISYTIKYYVLTSTPFKEFVKHWNLSVLVA